MVFYNELDKYAAAWLARLVTSGELPNGCVSSQDICELEASQLADFHQCHFFAGIGGWPLALKIAGWPDSWPVWSGSCPCQPFSLAGKHNKENDERHLWPTFRRLIAKRRPATLFGEQVASRDGRAWLCRVLLDLEAMGYAVAAADLCAASVGAPTVGQRLFWVGSTLRARLSLPEQEELSRAKKQYEGRATKQPGFSPWADFVAVACKDGTTRRIEPGALPLAYGLPASLGRDSARRERMELMAAKANRVGRIKGYGNAIVPELAAVFVRSFMDTLEN